MSELKKPKTLDDVWAVFMLHRILAKYTTGEIEVIKAFLVNDCGYKISKKKRLSNE